MLILQILLVPVFALVLLSAIFMIGVADTISPGADNQPDKSISSADKYYPPGRILPPL